jgi:hypothetical protein
MKTLSLSIFGACLLVALPASATAQPTIAAQSAEAAKLAEAHAIIEVMFPPAERQQTINKLVDQFSAQYQSSIPANAMGDPGIEAIVESYLDKAREQQRPLLARHMPELFEATAIAYTHEFSLAELKDIHAFALTPSGRHYLSRSAALLGDPVVAKANSALLADSQQLVKMMLPEMMGELTTYLKAHPDVAAKLHAENKTQ